MAFNQDPHGFSAASLLDPKSMKQQMHNGAKQTPPTSLSSGRQLLDPKSFVNPPKASQTLDKKPKQSPESTTTQLLNGNRPPNAAQDPVAEAEKGLSDYIERLHGVKDRSQRPSKRQKIQDESEPKKKAQEIEVRTGGDLGEYIREKRKKGIQEAMTNGIVDLTELNDDDDLVVTGEQKVVVPEVCYGRIEGAKVNAHLIPHPPSKHIAQSTQWPMIKVTLQRFASKDTIIRVLDPQRKDFGTIDIRTAVGLAPLLDRKELKVRTQGRLNPRPRGPYQWPGLEISAYMDMTLNIYGPLDQADKVGKWLSQRQIWLRDPFLPDNGIDYHNPQTPDGPALRPSATSNRYSGNGYNVRTVEEVRKDVTSMFDSLEESKNLPEAEADPRVESELMSHQKQGLHFLQCKEVARKFSDNEDENNSLWRRRFAPNGRISYYNIISGHEQSDSPCEVLGGILADMMGLGKTLSILALIVGSLDNARSFENDAPPEVDNLTLIRNSKTTLLIAPLSTLINWEDQIKEHLVKGALTYYIYHGPNRTNDVDFLAKHDIVITTYSIVASEYFARVSKNKASPLFGTHFFRVVLDEAHMIREQSTRQSQAICALSASRRWAVTGTPVQNRLEDLGSLIKFLRVQPFSDKGGFAQFILSPFKNGDTEVIAKLRVLVDSITLRRLKDTINLPGRHDRVVKLQFSEDERKLYDWFAKDSRNRLNVIAHGKLKGLGGKNYAQVLRAILRLRLTCAHGKELLSEEDLRITEGLSKDNAIDVESEGRPQVLGPRQAYEMLMLARESDTDTCVSCAKTVVPRTSDDDDDNVIGTMLPCYQLVCRECSEGVQALLIQQSKDAQFRCPYCEGLVPTSFFELTKEGIEEHEEQRQANSKNPRRAKVLGRYGGPHTKVKVLINELLESQKESECFAEGEAPIKSVVFSGWTSFLDLIQIALEDHGITSVRLDGKTSRKDRNAALTAFREDKNICVILISINAGGLGLNLTSGSKVYVMEPQFNPAAEAQAVDRVHRLGQTREVFISRFIMEDSFEEKMLDLQRRKQQLAELSLAKGKLDKAEAAKQKLEEIRSLFK